MDTLKLGGWCPVSDLRTACNLPADCRLYVSPSPWRDAPYALTERVEGSSRSAGAWIYVSPGSAEHAAIREHFGTLPEWPGEYVEIGEDN